MPTGDEARGWSRDSEPTVDETRTLDRFLYVVTFQRLVPSLVADLLTPEPERGRGGDTPAGDPDAIPARLYAERFANHHGLHWPDLGRRVDAGSRTVAADLVPLLRDALADAGVVRPEGPRWLRRDLAAAERVATRGTDAGLGDQRDAIRQAVLFGVVPGLPIVTR